MTKLEYCLKENTPDGILKKANGWIARMVRQGHSLQEVSIWSDEGMYYGKVVFYEAEAA